MEQLEPRRALVVIWEGLAAEAEAARPPLVLALAVLVLKVVAGAVVVHAQEPRAVPVVWAALDIWSLSPTFEVLLRAKC